MKVVLIDPSGYLHNFGLRMVARQLKEAGHEVEMIFALGLFPKEVSRENPFLAGLP